MEQYISKSAIAAEIERKIKEINLDIIEDWRNRIQREHDIEVMKNILSLIDTIEVKEVDLEKEFFDWYHEEKNRDYNASILYEKYGIISKKLAKHFYELGLKAQKGE